MVELQGWSSDHTSNKTTINVLKKIDMGGGLYGQSTYTLELDGFFPEYSKELVLAATEKLIQVKLISSASEVASIYTL